MELVGAPVNLRLHVRDKGTHSVPCPLGLVVWARILLGLVDSPELGIHLSWTYTVYRVDGWIPPEFVERGRIAPPVVS